MPKRAQVFEHSSLAVGEQGFTSAQFDSLVRYNERHGCLFFSVGHKRLHFGSYVGVIQVGDMAIEILPKVESDAGADKGKWQRALLQMLRQSGLVNVETAPEADLHLRRSSLVDVYLDSFLTEVEHLTHAGLVKRYRITEGNLYKLKGRILFPQQIRRNLLHRERTYTAHQTYDRDNVFNRILKGATEIVQSLSLHPSLSSRSAAAMLSFEDIADARITPDTFDRLQFDRNTERYRKAIQLARLIILNYSPDLRGGSDNVVAILFDMNVLFEKFVLAQLRRAAVQHTDRKIRISSQLSKRFWANKRIRPDIVLEFSHAGENLQVILDTKWKLPRNRQPSDEDLKQMYAYNLHFGSSRSILIYPMAENGQLGVAKPFENSASLPANHTHACEMFYLNLFDAHSNLRRDLGSELIDKAVLAPR